MTRPFMNLQSNFLNHFFHKSTTNENLTEQEINNHHTYMEMQEKAGYNCCRALYGCIRQGHRFNLYPEQLASDRSKGVFIGTFHHSEHLAREMVLPIYDVLREKMIDQLNDLIPGTGRQSPLR